MSTLWPERLIALVAQHGPADFVGIKWCGAATYEYQWLLRDTDLATLAAQTQASIESLRTAPFVVTLTPAHGPLLLRAAFDLRERAVQ